MRIILSNLKKLLRINIFFLCLLSLKFFNIPAICLTETFESLIGPRVQKKTRWFGNQVVSPSIQILVLAGHADSQKIEGSGTSGESVALKGLPPMDSSISDELFWNLKMQDAVVRIGKEEGLFIKSYDPGIRTIENENSFQTNWSVGARHAVQGGYSLEIHFDAYGKYGVGSGLIPPLSRNINNIDESLARTFGRYPLFYRGGLGAARRQIRILEIGKLEKNLEKNLRDVNTREKTINKIASRIVESILIGINKTNSFNPKLQEGDIFLQDSYL